MRFSDNPLFVRHWTALAHLHLLRLEGQCNSDHADAIRDGLAGAWSQFTGAEQIRLRQFSASLYQLTPFTPVDA